MRVAVYCAQETGGAHPPATALTQLPLAYTKLLKFIEMHNELLVLKFKKQVVLTIGRFSRDVALTGIVGKIGPTTSPTIETKALLDP
ncbi:hypothetical protein C0J52_24874 [Blattella germanica]|nr:hypothetical protein C0J52_24874 [Blattella germanica]